MDNMIPHKYGEFKESQVDYYKQKFRKKIFWLILYTDERTNQNYKNVDVKKFHKNLIFEISNCNKLLFYPEHFVEIINKLDCALSILESDHFDFNEYKKLVFDAGALISSLEEGE